MQFKIYQIYLNQRLIKNVNVQNAGDVPFDDNSEYLKFEAVLSQ